MQRPTLPLAAPKQQQINLRATHHHLRRLVHQSAPNCRLSRLRQQQPRPHFIWCALLQRGCRLQCAGLQVEASQARKFKPG